jgi:ABC-type transport system substrate-binding protein
MICNNDYHLDPDGYHVGAYNPDSVRVDSCMGSPTYGKLFAKRYFYLQFQPNYYPFDEVLKPEAIKTVAEISSSKADLKMKFQQLEVQFGTIYFQGLINDYPDTSVLQNPRIRLFFAEYNDIQEVVDTILIKIDTLKSIFYENLAKQPVSVNDSQNELNDILIYPNPVNNILKLNIQSGHSFSKLLFYNLQGIEVLSTEIKEQIEISHLPRGVYFLKYGNKTYKFIKE